MNGRMSLLFRNSLGVVVAIFAGLAAPMANAMDKAHICLLKAIATKANGLMTKNQGKAASSTKMVVFTKVPS